MNIFQALKVFEGVASDLFDEIFIQVQNMQLEKSLEIVFRDFLDGTTGRF